LVPGTVVSESEIEILNRDRDANNNLIIGKVISIVESNSKLISVRTYR